MLSTEKEITPPEEWSEMDFSIVAENLLTMAISLYKLDNFAPHAMNIIKRGIEQSYIKWLINNPGGVESEQVKASDAANAALYEYNKIIDR